MIKTIIIVVFLTLLSPMLAVAAAMANWQVYQGGPGLELSINRNAVWREKDGLIHFASQERFTHPQFDTKHQVHFTIRRTQGYCDCSHRRYVVVSVDFYTASNKHVWSTLHPTPRHAWNWRTVTRDSIASAMLNLVCDSARLTPRQKPV